MKKRILAMIVSFIMICSVPLGEIKGAEIDYIDTVETFEDVVGEEQETVDVYNSEEISELEFQDENVDRRQNVESSQEENTIDVFSSGEEKNINVTEISKEITASGTVNENIEWNLYDDGELIIEGNGEIPDWYSNDIWRSQCKKLVVKSGISSIGTCVFRNFTNMCEAVIPEGIITIRSNLFNGCTSLNAISLPEGVTNIEESAFEGCSSLNKITIPQSVTYIGMRAFKDCSDLSEIVIPQNIRDIYNYTFFNCSKLTYIKFSKELKNIGDYAFYECSNLKNIDSLKKVKNIGDCAFGSCYGLVNVVVSEKVENIGDFVFDNCRSVTTVKILANIKRCGLAVFQSCVNLKKIEFSGTVTCITNQMFEQCEKVTQVMIPEGVTDINTMAFGDCYNLEDVILPRSLKNIKDGAFYRCHRLEKILYNGTREEWNKINKNELEFENIKIYYKAEVHEHNYQEKILNAATCIKTGKKKWICDICGDSKIENIPVIEHSWDNGKITQKATCTTVGAKIYTCINCEKTRMEEIPALGHKEVKDLAVKATCEKSGKTEGSHCSVCKIVIKKQTTIPALGHSWNSGKVTKAATCTETGIKTYTCTRCQKTKTEEIKVTGHKEAKDLAVKATCEKVGKSEGSHCSVCGKVIKAQKEVPALGHSWNSGKVTKAATCTETGVKTYTCTRCQKTKTEEIKATGHKEVKDAAVAATCEKAGKTEGSHCSVCGNIIKKQENIPALQHKWSDEYTIEKDATCIENGKKEYICTVCGKNKTEKIPAIGHKWNSTYTVEKKETCTKTGEKDIRCSVCNAIKEKSVKKIPAKGHSFTVKKTISQATVLAAAKKEYECSVCGFKEIRSVGNKLKATMKVSTSKIVMKPQQKITSLKVTYAKGDSVTSWKIANTKLVKVTGKANGTCVLTAGKLGGTTTLTIKLKSGLIKKVSITVNVKTQQITGVSSKLTLVKGQYITIKPKLYPATSTDKITYKSNNSVVSVNSNGEIHARKKGTAVVTVKSGNKSVKIQITVEDPKLSKTSLSLDTGKKYALKVNGTKQKVTWSSSNKSVATINSNGVVTARRAGSTKIVAKIGTKKFICNVKVKLIITNKEVTYAALGWLTLDEDSLHYYKKKASVRKICVDTNNAIWYYYDAYILPCWARARIVPDRNILVGSCYHPDLPSGKALELTSYVWDYKPNVEFVQTISLSKVAKRKAELKKAQDYTISGY